MGQIVIRQIHDDEKFTVSRQIMAYAFQASPPLPPAEGWVQPFLEEATIVALFVDETPLACAAYSPMPQNIRGKLFSSAGIWGVATHPSARRQGYSRRLLAHMLAVMREAGVSFSNLYPFRESFYDRLGYVTFPQPRMVQIPARSFLPLLQKELPGRVSLTSMAESFSEHRSYLQQHQQSMHGMVLASEYTASPQRTINRRWVAMALINGEPHGMMLYAIKGNGENMEVPCFFYRDSYGKYLLLEWFARHADQVKDIELRLPPCEHPETWLPDLALTVKEDEAPMGRVVDVTAVGGMNSGPGQFSARLSDPLCPWNEGNYLFATVDGQLEVSQTETAQCHLTIQGLTALLYGTHDPESFAVRGWGDPSPTLQDGMRTMFPPRLPYLYEKY